MWDCPNPIFLDFETQSAYDISEGGGRKYAAHESTRVFILSLCADDEFHVWIPDYIRCQIPAHARLWPNELKPAKPVTLHRGSTLPIEIQALIKSNRPCVAHNAFGFDQFIWERFFPSRPVWLDTMYLARISGRPGGLDALSKRLLGQGKDRAKKLLKLLTTAYPAVHLGKRTYRYPVINPGDLAAFTTYAIADVELMVRLWNQFEEISVEADVIATHNAINARGVAVDEDLLDIIEQISIYSVNQAASEIARLTRGRLNADNIRSVKQVHEWLESWGVKIVDDNGKPCLRKEVVQQYINSPYIIEDNLTSAIEIPPLVINVLKLRMKALRITEAKVQKAKKCVEKGRIHDLHTYHQAHTGRASSQYVQIHNLPRPPKNVKLDRLIERFNSPEFKLLRNDPAKMFDFIKEEMQQQYSFIKTDEDKEAFSLLTVDDIASACTRPSFVARDKYKLVLCDFATVEVNGAAWIADEEKLLAMLRRQYKGLSKYGPYEEFAARMFGVPIEQVDSVKRQVAKSAVLGCQYGLGPDKFRVYAAAMGANLVEAGVTAEQVITQYRDTFTKIAGWRPEKKEGATSNFRVGGIWKLLEKAVILTVTTRVPQKAGKCTWMMVENNLVCILPSGRFIYYPDAKLEDVVPAYCYSLGLPLIPKATVTYLSTRGGIRKSLYGGLLTENVVQAICRDLLMCALVEFERLGLNPVMHIHDEGVCEVPEAIAEETLRTMVRIMSTTPDWAYGFPLACEGFISPRFVKKAFKGYSELHSKDLAI